MMAERRTWSAFTLLEVLVALALIAVVLSVAAEVAIQSLQGEKEVTRVIAAMDRRAFLVDALREDLGQLLNGAGEARGLSVTAGVPQRLEMTTLAYVDPDAPVRRPARVSYQLVRAHAEQKGSKLVREVVDLTRVDAVAERETLCEDIMDWNLEAWHEGQWRRGLPLSQKDSLPRLLRVRVRWADETQAGFVLPVRVEGI